MHADPKQADFCSYLSAILLGGLLSNALFGWWRMDPAAGLALVPIIVKEGVDSALRLVGRAWYPFWVARACQSATMSCTKSGFAP